MINDRLGKGYSWAYLRTALRETWVMKGICYSDV